jgi:hypothetical protein
VAGALRGVSLHFNAIPCPMISLTPEQVFRRDVLGK